MEREHEEVLDPERGDRARGSTGTPVSASTSGPYPLLALQRLAGNRAVAQFVQRQVEEGRPEESDRSRDFSAQLGVEEELAGSPGAPIAVQRKTSPGVSTQVAGTGDDIDVFPMPAAEIAAEHRRPGVVGWTTPAFSISFDGSSAQAVHATTSMRFTMQLAEEYTGARGQILRDHEQGHTRIGMHQARRHFDERLHDGIAALPRPFTPTAVRGVQDAVVADFRSGERAEAQAYDDLDYPRMGRAYQGARTSMEALQTSQPVLQRLIDGLRHFTSVGVAEIGAASDGVAGAIRACTREQLETVQYNPEFAGVADAAINRASQLNGSAEVPEAAKPSLQAAAAVMGSSLRHSTGRTVASMEGQATY